MGLFGDYNAESIDETFGVPDGERNLTISNCIDMISKNGNHGLMVTFTDDATRETLDQWQNLPDSGDASKDANSAKWLKRFLKSLEIPEARMAGVEPDDLIGIEVTATVYTQESGIYTNKKLRNIHIRRGSSMTSGSPNSVHSSESPGF